MASPSLVMVAGPNGSGKTTLIQTLRASPEITLPTLHVNADDLGREHRLEAGAAQKLAESLRRQAIAQRQSFLYETVMSHPSKIAELQVAAGTGYAITVAFVATDNPEINIERVRLRVADGGHDVPRDRIRARHRRSIALAPSAIAFATHAYVYDNTAWGTETAHQLQAVLTNTAMQTIVDRPAAWIGKLIECSNGRSAELDDIYQSARGDAFLGAPNLYAGSTEGPITMVGTYYVSQADRSSGKEIIHDKALLSKPVVRHQTYRIEYSEGVSKITRHATRIRAVRHARK